MASRKDPALMQALKVGHSADDHSIVVAMLKGFQGVLSQLHARVIRRANLTIVSIKDSNPKRAGDQVAKIDLRIQRSETFGTLGAKMATVIMRGGGAVFLYIDEGSRMVLGMPVGKPARALDNGDFDLDGDEVSPTTLALAPRHFDPVTISVLTAGIALLTAVIPIVLPMLIELGKEAFESPEQKAADAAAAKAAADAANIPAPANAIDAFADKAGIGTPGQDDTMKVGLIVAGLIGGVIVLRRLKKKG